MEFAVCTYMIREGEKMAKAEIHTWASRLIVLTSVLALAFVLGKYGVPILMPFLLAWLTVSFVRPIGKRLSGITALRPGVCCVAVLLLLLAGAGGALYLGGYYLWREAAAFYAWLGEHADSFADALGGLLATKGEGDALPAFLQRLLELPIIADFFGGLDALVQTLTSALLARLGESLTGAALHAATSLPSGVLSVLVYGLACFYLALDGERLLERALCGFAPDDRARIRGVCDATGRAIHAYLRAYGILFLLTLAELLIGFWIIGVQYAFLIAVIVSVLDVLPALGAAVVLVPWGIVSLAAGNVRVGAGLLILAGVVTLLRQIAEPKIVGKSLGLHPLVALLSMYVAFRLFGAIGLVLGPCAAIVVRSVMLRTNDVRCAQMNSE